MNDIDLPEAALQVWWIFLAATMVGLILTVAFVASLIIQQRRFLSTTREFAGRLLAAQEDERAWVARELHDDLIQRVAMLGQELEEMERESAAPGGAAVAVAREPIRVAGIREELHDLAAEIRRIAHRMHPAVLDHLGLPAALVQLGAEFGVQGLDVKVESSMAPETIPPAVATCLYRVAQEGLRNVVRHAHAKQAVIRLRPEAHGITLEIEDTGAGFETSSKQAAAGLGLTSLSERVRLVQGTLTIRSAPSEGTWINAWVPLEGGA